MSFFFRITIVQSTNNVGLEDVLSVVSMICNLILFNIIEIYTFRSFKFQKFICFDFSAQGCQNVGTQVIYNSTNDKKIETLLYFYNKINREIPRIIVF